MKRLLLALCICAAAYGTAIAITPAPAHCIAFCNPQPCRDSATCGRGCVCVRSSNYGGPGTCVEAR